MTDSLRYEVIPVLVMDLFSTGLSLIRLFTRRGLPVYGIDPDKTRIGFKSKFGNKYVCPNPVESPEKCVKFIKQLVKDVGKKMVAIPSSDSFALLLDYYRDDLSDYLYFALPDYSVKENIVSKKGLFNLAKKNDIPVPKTCFVDSVSRLKGVINEMRYPCIIKPEFSFDWHKGPVKQITKGGKVIIVNTPAEIFQYYNDIRKYSRNIVIQEIIVGPDENLVYFVSYTNRQNKVIASFAAKKPRVSPIHFGSASYAETIYDPDLNELCITLLEGCKFWGCSGIEMKKDLRDGQYKLIEINARYGLWDAMGTRFGVDTAYTAYRDILSVPVEEFHSQEVGFKWIKLGDDVRNLIRYYSQNELNFFEWLSSLKGEKMWDDICWSDPLPTLYSLWNIPAGLIRTIMRKIIKRLVKIY